MDTLLIMPYSHYRQLFRLHCLAMASGARRQGRVIFWVSFGACVLAWIGGNAIVVLTARAFSAPSTSMANTIRPGDHMLAYPTSQIRRGDVIVAKVEPFVGTSYVVRRVIGLPGDRVVCCDARGRITVNGKSLDETYVYPGDVPSMKRFNVTVPAGKFWLLGDHRAVALDSRVTGPVAIQIAGRVFLVLHSGHLVLLQTPSTFVTDGLAPTDNRIILPVAIGLIIGILGFLLVLLLSAVGVIRFAVRKRRDTRDRPETGTGSPTAPPSVPGPGYS
jgi:signal peptidase I